MNLEPDPGPSVSVAVQTLLPGQAVTITGVAVPAGRLRTVDLIRAKAIADWSLVNARSDVPGAQAYPPEWRTGTGGVPSTLEDAVLASVDAFRAGWYNILVDGSEPGGLDAWLTLEPDTSVAFTWAAPPPDFPTPGWPPADVPLEKR